MVLKGKITEGKPPSGKSNGLIQGKTTTEKAEREFKNGIFSPYASRPFVSETHGKRPKTVAVSRSHSLGPVTQKASLLNRKSSDPDCGMQMPNKIQSRSMSASRTHQRRLSMTRTSRVSTDSDQSSDKNYPLLSSQSAGNVTKRDSISKKRRPFSFSSDYKEEKVPPETNTTQVGDVQGFTIHRSSQILSKKNQPLSTRQESRSGNHVQFADLRTSSMDIDISEQPEASLNDQNDHVRDEEDISSTSLMKAKLSPNNCYDAMFSDWKKDFESELKKELSLGETTESLTSILGDHRSLPESNPKSSNRDQLMIARTDDLIMEVAKFIKQIKSSRAENFPVELNLSTSRPDEDDGEYGDANQSRQFSSSFGSVDGLSSISCPSVVNNQSGTSTFRDKSQREELPMSRPESVSLRKSLSNDDIHGRISLTLRMIEQEETRDKMKIASTYADHLQNLVNRIPLSRSESFLPSVSNPESRPPSRSSYISAIPPQTSTPRTPNQETLPSLPKMESILGNSDLQSARSCSCYSDHFPLNSRFSRTSNPELEEHVAASQPLYEHYCSNQDQHHQQKINPQPEYRSLKEPERPKSAADSVWGTSHEKTKKIFSFLDEVERTDRETLFVLKYDPPKSVPKPGERNDGGPSTLGNESKNDLPTMKTMDSLIRKGSVELAREQIILDRKLEESQYRIRMLEETLFQQRELNMRNLRNSEKDLKKRLNLQKEEFDLSFARSEALINEMATEKRILQERCDKLMKNFDENVEKYKEQIKSLQQKHLDEIKRLRKAQLSAEHVRKQQWVGNKTQEIREMTVKGLEPEVQRIIQRHQQEMSEMRAWHSDEIRETEERYQRKMNMQLQDLKEKFALELEDTIAREKEYANKKLESELKQREDEFETQKRRLTNDLYEERERVACEEIKWKDTMQENVRKVQIKGEILMENLKQEYEIKITNLERRHENELKSLKDIHEVEKESWVGNYGKKYDQAVKDREVQVTEALRIEMDKELREREKKLRDEFEKTRKEEEEIAEARNKRIQEKLQTELTEMDQTEKELKAKFTQAKSELINLEEQLFCLKTSLNLKDKQNNELQESNLKMLEERANLTSVIRREFSSQIEFLEDEVQSMKSTFVEVEAKHKMEMEQCQLEIEKAIEGKDAEIDQIGVRVKQAVSRKEETIQELQKQLDKANFQTQHLEGLIEQQRKDFLQSMTSSMIGGKRK